MHVYIYIYTYIYIYIYIYVHIHIVVPLPSYGPAECAVVRCCGRITDSVRRWEGKGRNPVILVRDAGSKACGALSGRRSVCNPIRRMAVFTTTWQIVGCGLGFDDSALRLYAMRWHLFLEDRSTV